VNVHEEAAREVASLLVGRGVGVEAGIWTVDAAQRWLAWSAPCVRVLLECMSPGTSEALADAAAMLAIVGRPTVPVLLHAEGPATWAVLVDAVRRGVDTRIGLEDTLVLPDGSRAPDNAALVAAAVALGAS
jgi:uncharacterized protein (DUF849 family)